MKITSYRNTGGVVTQRVLTLENALNAMRAETKSKPVSALRHNLQFIPPGVQSDYTEKLPLFIFGGIYKRTGSEQQLTCYNGLITLEINKLTGINEAKKLQMNSTRAIPQRDKPLGRPSVFPLCYPTHWGDGYGYHYEMPTTIYFPINYGHTNKMPVNELVVTLCHLMSYHWKPSSYPWMYMPYSIEQVESNDKPNFVATMFKTVSDELGVRYDPSRGCKLTPSQCVDGVIPFLRRNGYNSNIERFLYNDDENSFLKVYNNLRSYRPVVVLRMYQRNSYIDQNNDYLNDSYVIDGYQEVEVKVTKKKYFLGICVSTKVSYYYSDYFRFLYPWGGSFYSGTKIVNGEKATGWFQQDHVEWDNSNSSSYKKYTFINIY